MNNINLIYIQILTFFRLIYKFKLTGLLIYWKLIGRKGIAELNIPAHPGQIFLRKGTSDIAVFTSIFAFNEFDINFEVPSDGIIIDCGANIGVSTVYFASKYPQALIIALEPNQANFELCQKNTQDFKNVVCLKAAIWNDSCELFLQNPQDEDWAFRYNDRQNIEAKDIQKGEKVLAFSVPDLIKRYDLKKINIMKIDIEGAEKELFSGNSLTWMNSVDNFIVELHDEIVPGCSSAFYKSLNRFDFKQSISHEKIVIKIDN
jgi:FkbM family methyltransferase